MSGPSSPGADHVFARFYHDPTHGPVCEQHIGAEAGSPTVIERVTGAHIKAFPKAFRKFQETRASVRPVGLSLKRGLGLPDELAQVFTTHGVLDVETLAGLDDIRIHQLMPGAPEEGIDLRDRARLIFPDKAKWTKPVSLGGAERDPQDEIVALKARVAEAEKAGLERGAESARAAVETIRAEADEVRRSAAEKAEADAARIAALEAELAARTEAGHADKGEPEKADKAPKSGKAA